MGKTEQSVIIQALSEKVWDTIRNFHDMSWAPNVISKCAPVGDRKGDQIGAKRVLNDAFQETLMEFNEPDRTFRYTIDDGPSPVSTNDISGYVGVVRVKDLGDGSTQVEWGSSWAGKDEEVYDFCHPLYVAMLEDLKKTLS